ncbi:hypothetical protein TorRG33x02_190640, partial [Trema orientale]
SDVVGVVGVVFLPACLAGVGQDVLKSLELSTGLLIDQTTDTLHTNSMSQMLDC